MARTFSVSKLPASTLQDLRHRIANSDFSDYESHAAWLKELGYTISKSSIHRYAIEQEASIKSEDHVHDSSVEARLRCLEVASRLAGEHTSESLIQTANELLKWVYTR